VPGNWGRWQVNMIDSLANHIIFISENELSHFQELNGRGLKAPHSVIYNSADAEDSEKPFMGFEGLDGRFKILSLGNISYIKGIDRLVDVAEALRRLEDTQSVFIVCGRDADPRLARGMRERAERTGLQDYFRFVGWQAHPEAYLRACDAVINLTREDNPWGRDIIEAMTHGKPVVSLGHYSKFIEHGQTGVLLSNYHPESVARELIRLGQDSQYRDELGRKAKARSKELFDGRAQARRVEEIYEALVKSPGT
ncbi:MAG: glycosyltransferase family 4 protein, partial [Nitrospinota bacterium]